MSGAQILFHPNPGRPRLAPGEKTACTLTRGAIPEEARFVRRIGCPKTRQFDVMELGYVFMVVEVASEANATPGDHVMVISMRKTLNKAAVAVLKANDGEAAP